MTGQQRIGVPAEQCQLEQAWRTCVPAVLRFATALVGPHDAHDVVTTVFLRTTSSPSWTDIERLDRYLMRAVRNEALNLQRQRRRRWQRDLVAVRPESTMDVGADLDLLRAIAGLDVKQRCIVFLAYWEDLSESEIATLLNLSRSSVHRTLVRSRDRLRKALR